MVSGSSLPAIPGALLKEFNACRSWNRLSALARQRPLPPDLTTSPQADRSRIPRERDLLRSTEDWVADRVTHAIRSHHRRRLQRVGWEAALAFVRSGAEVLALDIQPEKGRRLEDAARGLGPLIYLNHDLRIWKV